MAKLTAAKRIENAAKRVEEASSELLLSAYLLNPEQVATWSGKSRADEVLRRARQYANAIRSLSRAGRAK